MGVQILPGRFQDGSAVLPAKAYILDPTLGQYRIGSNNEGFAAGGALRWDYNTTRLNLSSGYVLSFAADSGVSRLGAASLAIGNGTQGDFSGSLKLTSVTVTTFEEIGANPATAGGLRFANNVGVNARNAANSANLTLFTTDASNAVYVGDTGGTLVLNGGDILWKRALVALGGGAAPTFGTIGGSGPTTAAQNTWMRVLDSAGAAFWVPAWK